MATIAEISKVWLITGSTRGLGRALAEAVLSAGYRLMATARNPEHLSDLTAQYGDQVRTVVLDVSSERAASDAVAGTINAFGRLDVLANNAGYGNICPIEETSLAKFREQIETNLFGVINVTKAALPFMREQRSGHFLQFSSVGGRIGPIGRGPYAATAKVPHMQYVVQPGTSESHGHLTMAHPTLWASHVADFMKVADLAAQNRRTDESPTKQ
jgi:NAD(P)-dependent dehydrogenase (short-subunit alcohol dehydrogenase family)